MKSLMTFNNLILKVSAAGIFILFLGIGTFSTPTFSEENESVSALILNTFEMQQAQGEDNWDHYRRRFLARGCKWKMDMTCGR
jgi:hypothetical protein